MYIKFCKPYNFFQIVVVDVGRKGSPIAVCITGILGKPLTEDCLRGCSGLSIVFLIL